jgi:hypothetical protein
MFTVSSSFIGNFKLGDNINHNFKILSLLYGQFDRADEHNRRLLCKPITILLVSIVEALLDDFHFRIQKHTFEGVANLADSVIEYVRGKQFSDELEKYIASARKHDFFGVGKTNFYEALDELRRLRNRIHIQNRKGHLEPDDFNAFTESRKTKAEKVLEITIKTMAQNTTVGQNTGSERFRITVEGTFFAFQKS